MRGGVVLYDGECGLCAWSARFVFDHDPHGRFRFASLQGAAGRALLAANGLPDDPSAVVLVGDDGRVSSRSTAALRILSGLEAPWRWLALFRAVPRPWRDALYDFVARHRHRLAPPPACGDAPPGLRARWAEAPEAPHPASGKANP